MVKTITTMQIVLLGDAGAGKTSWLDRFTTGSFDPRYIPNDFPSSHDVMLELNNSTVDQHQVVFKIVDTPGQKLYQPNIFRDICIDADAIIIFYDLTSEIGWKNCVEWEKLAKSYNPNAQIVNVGNKADIKPFILRERPLPHYLVSAKSNYNYEKPLLAIAQHLLHNPDIRFV